jgi:hypothetical protein
VSLLSFTLKPKNYLANHFLTHIDAEATEDTAFPLRGYGNIIFFSEMPQNGNLGCPGDEPFHCFFSSLFRAIGIRVDLHAFFNVAITGGGKATFFLPLLFPLYLHDTEAADSRRFYPLMVAKGRNVNPGLLASFKDGR